MVAKSIVDIDVNDDKFVAFMERFREYQSALDDLPEAWRVAAVGGIGESSKQTEKAKGEAKELGAEFNAVAEAILTINSGIDRLNTNRKTRRKSRTNSTKAPDLRRASSAMRRKTLNRWQGISRKRRPAFCHGVVLSGYLPASGRWRPVWHQPAGGHHRCPAVYFSRARDEYRRWIPPP